MLPWWTECSVVVTPSCRVAPSWATATVDAHVRTAMRDGATLPMLEPCSSLPPPHQPSCRAAVPRWSVARALGTDRKPAFTSRYPFRGRSWTLLIQSRKFRQVRMNSVRQLRNGGQPEMAAVREVHEKLAVRLPFFWPVCRSSQWFRANSRRRILDDGIVGRARPPSRRCRRTGVFVDTRRRSQTQQPFSSSTKSEGLSSSPAVWPSYD